MTFHKWSLKNKFGPSKVLEKRFQFFVRNMLFCAEQSKIKGMKETSK